MRWASRRIRSRRRTSWGCSEGRDSALQRLYIVCSSHLDNRVSHDGSATDAADNTAGVAALLALAGTHIGPRHLVSGSAIEEADSTQTHVAQDGYQFITVPRALLPHVVDSLADAGTDFIKTYALSTEHSFKLGP